MFTRIRQFLLYNNAIPLLMGGLFLTSGAALAADEGVRGAVSGAIVDREERVVSIDNTYLLNTNLNRFTPELTITKVEEDDEHYYVSYTLSTIDLVEYVWQPSVRDMVLVVSKDDLGGRDLGLRVTRELKEVVAGQIALLRETQEIERRAGASKKVVATVYQGLVGRYFDPKLEEFPGYTPVVPDERPQTPSEPDSPAEPDHSPTLSMQLLGDNPMILLVGEPYVELGVVALRDGVVVEDVEVTMTGAVDSAAPGRYTIEYRATHGDLSALTSRVVRVQNGSEPDPEPLDIVPPTITLSGAAAIELLVGDVYTDAGATASDDVDGDLTALISTLGSVDTAAPGSYTITYSVSDAAGNTSEAVRIVTVATPVVETPPAEDSPEIPEPEEPDPEPVEPSAPAAPDIPAAPPADAPAQ